MQNIKLFNRGWLNAEPLLSKYPGFEPVHPQNSLIIRRDVFYPASAILNRAPAQDRIIMISELTGEGTPYKPKRFEHQRRGSDGCWRTHTEHSAAQFEFNMESDDTFIPPEQDDIVNFLKFCSAQGYDCYFGQETDLGKVTFRHRDPQNFPALIQVDARGEDRIIRLMRRGNQKINVSGWAYDILPYPLDLPPLGFNFINDNSMLDSLKDALMQINKPDRAKCPLARLWSRLGL